MCLQGLDSRPAVDTKLQSQVSPLPPGDQHPKSETQYVTELAGPTDREGKSTRLCSMVPNLKDKSKRTG